MLHFATLLAAATLLAIDLTKSTSDNYASPSAPLREEYLQSRARLDYGWHVKYSLERQAVQDSIVASILSAVGKSPPPPVQPWVVFTAGCMGAVRRRRRRCRSAAAALPPRASRPRARALTAAALPLRASRPRSPPPRTASPQGKTHVMKLLDRRDVLPLRDFVCIDLDRIREALPEHPQYVAADPERAGLLTQAEAGTIGEVATEEAFRRGRHVWIDSTLRDGGWWSREIARIRATYPRYKLAILLVEASWPRVLHRSRRRSEATGRGIPEPILRSVFEQARARAPPPPLPATPPTPPHPRSLTLYSDRRRCPARWRCSSRSSTSSSRSTTTAARRSRRRPPTSPRCSGSVPISPAAPARARRSTAAAAAAAAMATRAYKVSPHNLLDHIRALLCHESRLPGARSQECGSRADARWGWASLACQVHEAARVICESGDLGRHGMVWR